MVNLTDDLGGTRAAYHLDAFGQYRFPAELDASRNRFGLTGHLFDRETGLYFAKARYLDPELGRFISQDSFLGQIDNPPSLHRYFYGHANPTRYIDPDGHIAQVAAGAIAGGLIGAGLNLVRQTIAIAEGAQDDFNWWQLGSSIVGGAVIGGTATVNPILAARMGYAASGLSVISGGRELVKGNKWTGAFDIATGVAGAFGARKLAELGKDPAPKVLTEGRSAGQPELAPATKSQSNGPVIDLVQDPSGAWVLSDATASAPSVPALPAPAQPAAALAPLPAPATPVGQGAPLVQIAPPAAASAGAAAAGTGSGQPSTAYDRGSIVRGPYKANRAAVLQRDPQCQYCQAKPSTTADHVVPAYDADALVGAEILSRNEAVQLVNELNNLLGACPSCNSGKKAALPGNTPGTWRPPNPSPRAIEIMKQLGTWREGQ